VAAAGNDHNNNDTNPFYPAAYDLSNVLAVAATDHKDQVASFSNYGKISVDLGAPGVDILSTLPGNQYGYLSGTSMAAPHVTGVAGLVYAQFPALTPAEVKARILSSVDPIKVLQSIVVTGGRLNAAKALAP
jgi:subtilisin family serine protease